MLILPPEEKSKIGSKEPKNQQNLSYAKGLLFLLLSICPVDKTIERAFSGKYLYEARDGIYRCVNCKNNLFDSNDKYDAGAGWPSFCQTIQIDSVYYVQDCSLPFKRYIVCCRKCDAHLGHVFNDGPPPKGLRYCIISSTLILEDRV